MKRKTITIIAALAAVAILIGGYFGAQAWLKANPRTPAFDFNFDDLPPSPRLTEFDASRIMGIENVGEGFALERREGNWELVSENTATGNVRIEQSIISSRLWSISNVWAESLIDEDPEDISMFGLDNPRGRVIITDSDGTQADFIFGNLTPSRTSTYLMMATGPSVYTLSSWTADMLLFSLDSIRNKNLFSNANFDPRLMTRFILEPRPGDNPSWEDPVYILPRESDDLWITPFTGYTLHAPFNDRQGVDSEHFHNLMESLMQLQIQEFVDDNPSSLASYGLDNPGRLYVETPDETIELLFGRAEQGLRYAMRPGDNSVFTLLGFEPFVETTPFQLMDKFAFIVNIDNVDSFTIAGEGRTLEGRVQGTGDDAIFQLNGRIAADRNFRTFYQTVIGLLIDAELVGPPTRGEGTDVVVQYRLNTPAGVVVTLRLIPYNRDFYILEREGNMEFLIARTQVRRIFDSADQMVYAD